MLDEGFRRQLVQAVTLQLLASLIRHDFSHDFCRHSEQKVLRPV